jgi:hypothetical protein
MAAKKLAPHAKKLANPKVDVDGPSPDEANRDQEPDARGPHDRDGNAGQARERTTERRDASAQRRPKARK